MAEIVAPRQRQRSELHNRIGNPSLVICHLICSRFLLAPAGTRHLAIATPILLEVCYLSQEVHSSDLHPLDHYVPSPLTSPPRTVQLSFVNKSFPLATGTPWSRSLTPGGVEFTPVKSLVNWSKTQASCRFARAYRVGRPRFRAPRPCIWCCHP
eukprot:scaffold1502_cov229-Pinguiococcus_pyrenoidosus.AAC.2